MTPSFPYHRRASGDDPTLRRVAMVATAIAAAALAALAGALLSWHALTTPAAARPGAAAGVVLAAAGPALVVDGLDRDGRAIRAGLRVGDVVEAVDGTAVTGIAAADRALAAPTVDIRVRRGDKAVLIHLPAARSAPLG